MNIKKGDTVHILAGNDKGKEGEVIKVNTDSGRVVVDGVNVYKKHVRPKKQGESGEVVEVPRSIDHSNVSLVCQACGNPTRVGKKEEGDKKVRQCKKCNATIE